MGTIRRKDKVSFNGVMDANIKANGRMANSMGREFWLIKRERKSRQNGLMEKESKINRETNPIMISDHQKYIYYIIF
jgi:hypothetical protein